MEHRVNQSVPAVVLLAAALGGCSTGEFTLTNTKPSAIECKSPSATPAPMRLLTRRQYDNTLRDLLGDDSSPSRNFPPENQVMGFDNNAEAHQTSPLLVERYMEAAEAVAARAVQTRLSEIAPCAVGIDEAACGAEFIARIGAQAFRRPLLAEESAVFSQLFVNTRREADYSTAVELVLEAMLQSPQFLYRIDVWDDVSTSPEVVAVGPYEIAARLSYLFWDTMPDQELMAAAQAGQLGRAEDIAAQARRLLADPRARQTVENFNRQWLGLDEFEGLVRQVDLADSADFAGDWKGSLARFLDHAYFEAGDFGALFMSPTVFVNERLAPLYGLTTTGSGYFPMDLAGTRAGLLTQPALLTLLAHADQSSPIRRGVFVRERILCETLPPPPPNVNNAPPDPDPNATTRERFQQHTVLEECAGCHRLIDPIGFGFENYDHLGRHRSDEAGSPIDASGAIVGSQEAELNGSFVGALELADRLSKSPQVQSCLARQWYTYAVGRVPARVDDCSLAQLTTAFAASNGDLLELLVALTQTDAFRYRITSGEGER